jgi:hypothetical protein
MEQRERQENVQGWSGRRVTMLGVLLVAAACAWGCTTGTYGQARQLREAGERLGLPVRSEGMVQFTEGGATMFLAPAVSLDAIPATRYPDGVDLGIAYLDLPPSARRASGGALPKGFYKLRGFAASANQVGPVDGKIQLIDGKGRVVAELPASLQIRSLTVPPPSPGRQTLISLGGARCDDFGGFNNGPSGGSTSTVDVCVCCGNGVRICMNVFTGALSTF